MRITVTGATRNVGPSVLDALVPTRAKSVRSAADSARWGRCCPRPADDATAASIEPFAVPITLTIVCSQGA